MSLVAGAVVAKFKGDMAELKSGIGEAKSMMGSLKTTGAGVGTAIKDSFTDFMNTAKIAAAVGVGAFSLFAKSSIDAKTELDKAIISLDIIAERFGYSGKEAGKLAQTLGQDLRIGTSSASDAMQNLIKSGLSLDQASDLLKRFTNEAMTGKSSSIDLATAVQNLSFAYATGNSALGNMSGISENWSDITEKGVDILGKWNGKANEQAGITPQLAKQIQAYEKELKAQGKTLEVGNDEQGKYIGLLALTNLTMGSSERFQGTYADKMAEMALKMTDVKIALGTLLQNALTPLIDWFNNSGVLDTLTRFINILGNLGQYLVDLAQGKDVMMELTEAMTFFTGGNEEQAKMFADAIKWLVDSFVSLGKWIAENKELVLTFLQGMAIAIGALLVIGVLIGLFNALFNPITLIIIAVGLLYTAWQTNFWGIRDITQVIIDFVMQVFKALQKFWKDWGDEITMFLTGLWNIIVGIIKIAVALFVGIITTALALLNGDWKTAWNTVKTTAKLVWDGIVQVIKGAIDVLQSAILSFVQFFTGQLDNLWKKATEIGGKIKDALEQISPFHKSSPSLVEYVEKGADDIAKTYAGLQTQLSDLAMKGSIMGIGGISKGTQPAQSPAQATGTTVVQNITQNIQDSADAQMVNEQLAFQFRNAI